MMSAEEIRWCVPVRVHLSPVLLLDENLEHLGYPVSDIGPFLDFIEEQIFIGSIVTG